MPRETIEFSVTGATCAACTTGILGAIADHVVAKAATPPKGGRSLVRVTVDVSELSPLALTYNLLKDAISEIGFEPEAHYHAVGGAGMRAKPNTQWRVTQSIIAGVTALSWFIFHEPLVDDWEHSWPKKCGIPVVALILMGVTGNHFFRVHKKPDMNWLITLSAVSAWLYSVLIMMDRLRFSDNGSRELFFDSPFIMIAVLNISGLLKEKIDYRLSALTESNENALLSAMPTTATFCKKTAEAYFLSRETVNVSAVSKKDAVIVTTGERIPVDVWVQKGTVSVNEGIVTGDHARVVKQRGETVYAGSVVLEMDEKLFLEAQVTGGASVINRMVDATLFPKSEVNRLSLSHKLETVTRYFVWGILLTAGVTAGGWALAGQPFPFVMRAVMDVFFGACPCSFALSTPAALAIAYHKAYRHRFQIHNDNALTCLSKATTVVFDKTGTLTEPDMADLRLIDDYSEYTPSMIWQYAAALEAAFLETHTHPVASAIVRAASAYSHEITERIVSVVLTKNKGKLSHQGIIGKVNGAVMMIGTRAYLESNHMTVCSSVPETHDVLIAYNGKLRASTQVEDVLRSDAKETIQALQAKGIRCVMMTGSGTASSQALATQLGFDEAHIGMTPVDKAGAIQRLQEEAGGVVAFIGDGANDAAAASQADVSIAIDHRTALASTATIDVALNNQLAGLGILHQMASDTHGVITGNIRFSIGYNALAMLLAAVIFPAFQVDVPPYGFGIAMGLSSLAVVLNASRLGYSVHQDVPLDAVVAHTEHSPLMGR